MHASDASTKAYGQFRMLDCAAGRKTKHSQGFMVAERFKSRDNSIIQKV